MSLSHASKLPLLTFYSRQRPDVFDLRQICVKVNVQSAPTPLIRLLKIVAQLCYTFDANQRSDID